MRPAGVGCLFWVHSLWVLCSIPGGDDIPAQPQGFPFKMCSVCHGGVQTAFLVPMPALRQHPAGLRLSQPLICFSVVASWLLQKPCRTQFTSWILQLHYKMGINMPKRHWSFSTVKGAMTTSSTADICVQLDQAQLAAHIEQLP